MKNSIIIIGAGMGGLSAGCYGQMNGYDTQIFEMHTLPGGQCASWKRKGYTFDVCIHHLFGCSSSSKIYQLWNELGTMPRELVQHLECTSVLSPDGRLFIDYYDPDRLEDHLNQLSPVDSKATQEYIHAIMSFMKGDLLGEMMLGSPWSLVKMLPSIPASMKWFRLTMQQFAKRFSDPFLRRAFPLLVYSAPATPLAPHLMRHAYGINKGLQWPVGGALEFARSIEKRYKDLGGKIHYGQKVERILVENDLMTWERFMGGTHGFVNSPNKKFSFITGMRGTGGVPSLPGLSNFYFVGVWASMAPALFGSALSGRKVIRTLCRKDGKNLLVFGGETIDRRGDSGRIRQDNSSAARNR